MALGPVTFTALVVVSVALVLAVFVYEVYLLAVEGGLLAP